MSSRNRERRKLNREARAAAEAAARRRAKRQRWAFSIGALVVALAVALALVVNPTDDDDDVEAGEQDTTTTVATTTTTTVAGPTTTAVGSVAGQPCVALAEPLPEGAPDVPVQEGPPPTELVIEDLVEGDGDEVPAGATVTVDYIGVACSTGKIFDASYGGQPATFPLDGVIAGWTQGIPGMKVGGQRLLGIPSALAYGPSSQGELIAPDETLWFVVEMKEFTPAS